MDNDQKIDDLRALMQIVNFCMNLYLLSAYPIFLCTAFQISLAGISVAARPRAMQNSSMLTAVKPKSSQRKGIPITPTVSTTVRAREPHSH